MIRPSLAYNGEAWAINKSKSKILSITKNNEVTEGFTRRGRYNKKQNVPEKLKAIVTTKKWVLGNSWELQMI